MIYLCLMETRPHLSNHNLVEILKLPGYSTVSQLFSFVRWCRFSEGSFPILSDDGFEWEISELFPWMPSSKTGCGYAQIHPSKRNEWDWSGGTFWATAEVPEEAVGAVSVSPKKQSRRVAGCSGGMGNAGASVGNHRVWCRELQGQWVCGRQSLIPESPS